MKPTTLTTEFTPTYYLDAYHLAKDGYTDREIAKHLTPPVKYTALLKWKRDDPHFERSINKGRDEREPQAAIERVRNPNQMAFLMAFVECGSVKAAAASINMTPFCHYNWLRNEKQSGDMVYHDAFAMAEKMFADTLLAEAIRRGRDGVRRYKFNQGTPCVMPCDKSHPEAQEFEDKNGNTFYGYYYYEMHHSDQLLSKLLDAKVDGFQAESTKTEVNVGTTVVMQDMLEQAEAARGKVIDADYVRKFAEASVKLETTQGQENDQP